MSTDSTVSHSLDRYRDWCDPDNEASGRISDAVDIMHALAAMLQAAITEHCDQCDGSGWLEDQSYGYADVPAGWTPIQRCDACERFDGDEAAAVAFAQANGGQVLYFPTIFDEDTTTGEPGDRAVQS